MRGVGNPRVGGPISLILVLVFPAMIAAAVALAYYGFKHAEDVSRPVEQLFRQESQDYAEGLAKTVESRLDREALSLFAKISALEDDPSSTDPCDLDPGPGIDSFVVLGETRRIECTWPRPRENDSKKRKAAEALPAKIPWLGKIRNLTWAQVDLDSFAYHHDMLDSGGSALLAYTARKASDGDLYHIVARLKLDFVGVHFYGNISSLDGAYDSPYPSFVGMLKQVEDLRNVDADTRTDAGGQPRPELVVQPVEG